MTRDGFFDATQEGWFAVGKFSNISQLTDGTREFLEAIIHFKTAIAANLITERGYQMPDVGSVTVGRICDIAFVADDVHKLHTGRYTDGLIVVRRA